MVINNIIKSVNIGDIEYRNYINDYWISSNGIICRIEFDNNNHVNYFKMLKQETSNFGHKRVEIKIDKSPKKVLIHRVVYEVWCGVLKDGMVIEHLDGNPANNNYTNLKQSTQKENINTAINQGTFQQMWSNKTNIVVYDKLNDTTKGYECIRDFMIDIGAPQYMINHGALSDLNKRTEYKNRYVVEKIGRKGREHKQDKNIYQN